MRRSSQVQKLVVNSNSPYGLCETWCPKQHWNCGLAKHPRISSHNLKVTCSINQPVFTVSEGRKVSPASILHEASAFAWPIHAVTQGQLLRSSVNPCGHRQILIQCVACVIQVYLAASISRHYSIVCLKVLIHLHYGPKPTDLLLSSVSQISLQESADQANSRMQISGHPVQISER